MKKGLISITMPVYNNNVGACKSVKSIINQSYDNWELIIVDDGSEPPLSVEDCIKNDSRIKLVRFDNNMGRPFARQKAFSIISGEFCGFLDAGDLYKDNYLELAYKEFTSDSSLEVVSQSMEIIYDNISYFSKYNNNCEFGISDDKFLKVSFASSIIKSYMISGFSFNTNLKYSQDKDFLHFLSKNNSGKVKLINSFNYVYNQGNKMLLSTTVRKYYYDIMRLISINQFFLAFESILKGVVIIIVQTIFGYKAVLRYRFL